MFFYLSKVSSCVYFSTLVFFYLASVIMILRNRGTIVVGVGIFVHTLFHTQDTFCFESFCSPTFRSLKASHKTCGGKHLISQNREMNEFGATDRNPVTPNMKFNTQSRECTLSSHAGSNHGPFHYE